MSNAIPSVRILPAETNMPGLRPGGEEKPGFVEALENAISQVEKLHGEADAKVTQLLEGNGSDVHSTMIAVEKADLSFQLMMQVRNKIVQAYRDIANMQF
jgi:flagellar hook-basal body complex protein FliE